MRQQICGLPPFLFLLLNPGIRDKKNQDPGTATLMIRSIPQPANLGFQRTYVFIEGERGRYYRRDALGRVVPYKPVEHTIPGHLNGPYQGLMRYRYYHEIALFNSNFQLPVSFLLNYCLRLPSRTYFIGT